MDARAKALPLSVDDPVSVAVAHLEGEAPASRLWREERQARAKKRALRNARLEPTVLEACAPSREQVRSRRHREVRAKTISTKRMPKHELELGRLLNPPVEGLERPRTRAECAGGRRPCPFVSCAHHLYLDVSAKTGSIKLNFPDLEVWQMDETCALDLADRGGVTLEETGRVMNVTRERIRQVEVKALGKVMVAIERGDGGDLAEYAAPGPAGKRRLPILQARGEVLEEEELELEEDELEELAAAPAPPAAFDVDDFVGLEDVP